MPEPHTAATSRAPQPRNASTTSLMVVVAVWTTSTVLGAELLEWAKAWPERQWAVEGASGLGRGIAQLLAAAGRHRHPAVALRPAR